MSDIALNTEKETKQTVNPVSVDNNDSVVISIEDIEEENTPRDEKKRTDVCLEESNKIITEITTGKEFVVYEVLTRRSTRLPTQGKHLKLKDRYRSGEDADPDADVFEYEPNTRNYFIKKVMIIVLIMLLLTAIPVIVLIQTPKWSYWFEKPNGYIFLLVAIAVELAVNFMMGCFSCASRPPVVYIMLILSWLAITVICIVLCLSTKTVLVLYALAATVVVVIVCILLACTSYDFTKWMLYMIVISIVFVVLVIIVIIVQTVTKQKMTTIHLVILFVSTIINVIFLIMELQMVIGGKSIELNEDEYCLAAFMLYNSIVEIFIALVQIFGILGD